MVVQATEEDIKKDQPLLKEKIQEFQNLLNDVVLLDLIDEVNKINKNVEKLKKHHFPDEWIFDQDKLQKICNSKPTVLDPSDTNVEFGGRTYDMGVIRLNRNIYKVYEKKQKLVDLVVLILNTFINFEHHAQCDQVLALIVLDKSFNNWSSLIEFLKGFEIKTCEDWDRMFCSCCDLYRNICSLVPHGITKDYKIMFIVLYDVNSYFVLIQNREIKKEISEWLKKNGITYDSVEQHPNGTESAPYSTMQKIIQTASEEEKRQFISLEYYQFDILAKIIAFRFLGIR